MDSGFIPVETNSQNSILFAQQREGGGYKVSYPGPEIWPSC